MQIQKCPNLHQLRRSSIVRIQIQGPLDDVSTGAASLVIFRLLAFAENLDGGKSSDLHTENTSTASVLWVHCPGLPINIQALFTTWTTLSVVQNGTNADGKYAWRQLQQTRRRVSVKPNWVNLERSKMSQDKMGSSYLEEQLLVTHGRDLGIKNSETRTRKTDVKCE